MALMILSKSLPKYSEPDSVPALPKGHNINIYSDTSLTQDAPSQGTPSSEWRSKADSSDLVVQVFEAGDENLIFLSQRGKAVFTGINPPWFINQEPLESVFSKEQLELLSQRSLGRQSSIEGVDSVSSSSFSSITQSRLDFLIDRDGDGYLVIIVVSFDKEGSLRWKIMKTGYHIYNTESPQLLAELEQASNVIIAGALESIISGYEGSTGSHLNHSSYPTDARNNPPHYQHDTATILPQYNETWNVPGTHTLGGNRKGGGYRRFMTLRGNSSGTGQIIGSTLPSQERRAMTQNEKKRQAKA